MERRLFRILYALEFLAALLVVFTTWSQVGGQSHLDQMPWYLKLALVLAAASAIVKLTAAIAQAERFWTRRGVLWLCVLIFIASLCGLATLYYHLHEPADEEQDTGDIMQTAGSPYLQQVIVPLNRLVVIIAADGLGEWKVISRGQADSL